MKLTEEQYARAGDREVQRLLATDKAYRNAANAEEQAEREEQIVAQVEARIQQPDPSTPA
jgi:hypothetical protein